MRFTMKVQGSAVAALAAISLAAWAPPALAAGPDGDAIKAAETATQGVEAASVPDSGDVAFGQAPNSAGMVMATSPTTEITAPVDSKDPIVIGTHGDEAVDVKITLPTTTSATDVEVVEGDTVYVDEQSDTSYVIDATNDGARIMSVLESPAAPHEIPYVLGVPEGASLIERADGSVDVAWVVDGVEAVIGTVEAPWAVDANGNQVATRYVVDGMTLTQVVEPTADTEYPVTADPTYAPKWWGTVVRFNRSETQTVASGGGPCAALMARIPVAGWPLAAACGLYGAIAGDAISRKKCLRVNVYNVGGLTPWHGTC